MTWCLMAPSHYLNQYWLIIKVVCDIHLDNLIVNAQDLNPWYEFENYWFKITAASYRSQWVKIWPAVMNALYQQLPGTRIHSLMPGIACMVITYCSHMNATIPHWRLFNIDSGNGLVPSGNKPLPASMMTRFQSPHSITRGQWVKDWLVEELQWTEKDDRVPEW